MRPHAGFHATPVRPRSCPSATIVGIIAVLLAACMPDTGEDTAGTRTDEVADTIPPPPYTEETLPQSQPPSAGVPGASANMQRPASQIGVLMLEGAADSVEFRLVQSPAGFPAGFSTYIPADMQAQPRATDAGHSLEIVANFGDVRNERAYLQFFFYPAGTSLALARTNIDSFITGLNPEVDRSRPVTPYPWATEQIAFSYPHEQQTFVGHAAIAQRGAVPFHLIVHYPAEYGDGMGPRVDAVLREWRWDDGSPLMR